METTLELGEGGGVAEVRREAVRIAKLAGLSESRQADVALVVTEAATNILKYAGAGHVRFRLLTDNVMPVPAGVTSDAGSMPPRISLTGLEILAVDKGPGVVNTTSAEYDGFSTSGSLGAGLGTMRRHASVFDWYSLPGGGTTVLSQFYPLPSLSRPLSLPASGPHISALSTPKAGQLMCGDGWSVHRLANCTWIVLLDGLGHGPLAHDASRKAIDVVKAARESDTPEALIHRAHTALKGSRGAVMAVARISHDAARLDFAGIGNIIALVQNGTETTRLLSMDGTVGYMVRTVRASTVAWGPDAVFIASTDGLSTRWNLQRHPGLLNHHPSVIAAVLHRDFARDNDDATVIVAKERGYAA